MIDAYLAKARNISTQTIISRGDLPEDISLLQDILKELQNAIHHLEKSNEELALEDPADEVYREAIEENKSALQRKRERVEMVKRKIFTLGGICAFTDNGTLVTHNYAAHQSSNSRSSSSFVESGAFSNDQQFLATAAGGVGEETIHCAEATAEPAEIARPAVLSRTRRGYDEGSAAIAASAALQHRHAGDEAEVAQRTSEAENGSSFAAQLSFDSQPQQQFAPISSEELKKSALYL